MFGARWDVIVQSLICAFVFFHFGFLLLRVRASNLLQLLFHTSTSSSSSRSHPPLASTADHRRIDRSRVQVIHFCYSLAKTSMYINNIMMQQKTKKKWEGKRTVSRSSRVRWDCEIEASPGRSQRVFVFSITNQPNEALTKYASEFRARGSFKESSDCKAQRRLLKVHNFSLNGAALSHIFFIESYWMLKCTFDASISALSRSRLDTTAWYHEKFTSMLHD